MLTLSFDGGTLLLEGDDPSELDDLLDLPGVKYDERVRAIRAPAIRYYEIFAALYRRQKRGELTFTDEARAYDELELELAQYREPYPHQGEALEAWLKSGRRGLVVLPTGAGKSYIAELAIWKAKRSALVVAPTIDLMNQWYDLLTTSFQRPVGIVGGGYHDVEDLTVTTYDSSYIHMERLGNRFGLIIFDEAHHLPGPTYAQAAEMALAPWRLGLTATPERPDGQHALLDILIGPCVYRKRIKELAGQYLAEYTTVPVHVPLSEEDAEEYHQERKIYKDFTWSQGIRMGSRHGWSDFLKKASSSREGRRAFRAYRRQRQIALAHSGKIQKVEDLLRRHARDRVIVFTNDNDTVYEISRRFLLPCITHKTPTRERKLILERFNAGTYPCLVTSKVLNEGVNVPEANIAIVLSGSGTVREHVQRLGRILRRQPDKHATLYELITSDTVEQYVSNRRRDHDAYR